MRRPHFLMALVGFVTAACAPSETPPDLVIENVTVVDAVQGAVAGRTSRRQRRDSA